MLKKILYVIVFIVFAYFALCVVGPKKMDVSTKRNIEATPTAIFSQIAELRNMQNWSKWILEDTTMELNFGKTSSGIGGTYSWKSKKSGEGSMTITNIDVNKMLAYDLSFKGWDAVAKVKMELVPQGKSTEVTWSMKDDKEFPFYLRGMMFVMNMNGSVKKTLTKV
ncbi:MAG: SRPBCC family protein [Bacteroidetes bacterium]|nr:SRPBCC family protein [Bacteroidota bacterium]